MVILGLPLNKTSQQEKKAVKGVRGKERRYRRKAINMPEGKRRYKQRRTCYLSMIARDWFLCFINHSNSKTCSAPFPTLRRNLNQVQEGSNDNGFQTSVCCFYFNSLQLHCLKALHACCLVYHSHAVSLCPAYFHFQTQKDAASQLKRQSFWFFLRWNTEYYNREFSCLPKFLQVISYLMDQLIHRPRMLPAISLTFHLIPNHLNSKLRYWYCF